MVRAAVLDLNWHMAERGTQALHEEFGQEAT